MLKRKRTTIKVSEAPPTPHESPPPIYDLPFPQLPSQDHPQTEQELLNTKSMLESGVLATALSQSREVWISGLHFPKVWKPTRLKKKGPAASSQYITTRLGVCPVTIGPHTFPETRWLSVRKVEEKVEGLTIAPVSNTVPNQRPVAVTYQTLPQQTPVQPLAYRAPAPVVASSKSVIVSAPTIPPPTTKTSEEEMIKTLKALAEQNPTFLQYLEAVSNGTATPEQTLAVNNWLRAGQINTQATVSQRAPATSSSASQAPKPASSPLAPIPTIQRAAPIPSPSPKVPTPMSSSSSSLTQPPSSNTPPSANPSAPSTPPEIQTEPPPATNTTLTQSPKPPIPPTSQTPTNLSSERDINISSQSSNPSITPINVSAQQPSGPAIGSSKSILSTPNQSFKPVTKPVSLITQPINRPTTVPQAPQQPQLLRSVANPMEQTEIAFELVENAERLLLPRHTILEKSLHTSLENYVLASFILLVQNDTAYVPITLRLNDCPPRLWDSLYKYVHPQQTVAQEMEKIMKSKKRCEAEYLRLRIQEEEENFKWKGIKREKGTVIEGDLELGPGGGKKRGPYKKKTDRERERLMSGEMPTKDDKRDVKGNENNEEERGSQKIDSETIEVRDHEQPLMKTESDTV